MRCMHGPLRRSISVKFRGASQPWDCTDEFSTDYTDYTDVLVLVLVLVLDDRRLFDIRRAFRSRDLRSFATKIEFYAQKRAAWRVLL